MPQSKIESLIEALLNTASGILVGYLVATFVYPLYGFTPPPQQIFEISLIFTCAGITKSYLWRRFFNKRLTLDSFYKKAAFYASCIKCCFHKK